MLLDDLTHFMLSLSGRLTKYASRCMVSPGSSKEIERFRSVSISVLRASLSAVVLISSTWAIMRSIECVPWAKIENRIFIKVFKFCEKGLPLSRAY